MISMAAIVNGNLPEVWSLLDLLQLLLSVVSIGDQIPSPLTQQPELVALGHQAP